MDFRALAMFGALVGTLVAADQRPTPAEAQGREIQKLMENKDFVKPFSAPKLMKDIRNASPQQYLQPPGPVSIVPAPKQCSIPLLWAHADSRLDRGSVIPMGQIDGTEMRAPNPAPACKNWGEEIGPTKQK